MIKQTISTGLHCPALPQHLQHGAIGERAAKVYLQRAGLRFLAANFRSKRGEVDLIFRDPKAGRQATQREINSHGFLVDSVLHVLWTLLTFSRFLFTIKQSNCLVFVEVKTRSSEVWNRPAAAVDETKRQHLSRAAQDYLRKLHHPRVKFRFDIVEVLLEDGRVRKVRHLPNAFPLSAPFKYG